MPLASSKVNMLSDPACLAQVDLQIDHDIRGPGRADCDLMVTVAHLGDAINDFGRNVRLIHSHGHLERCARMMGCEETVWLFIFEARLAYM
jgi:hypothetical protein